MRRLELLAPAKNLTCGMAAIDHGADAVYIGADRFGARAAVGNTVDDIKTLCHHAHQYGARVYVTVNTIIYEDELEDTRQLIERLSAIGVDAILVQDMCTIGMRQAALNSVGRAPMLHASTQCDVRTVEKVSWLRSLGFSRVVLARELTLEEIRHIHQSVPDMEIEAFVHGALCVSYSGVCYASQRCFDRSANRGECAQFCRMPFDLIDANDQMIEEGRHLLSLRDLSQIDSLEELANAGVTSFKIEGRLKDVGYVKNVVSAYSQKLNKLIARQPDDFRRSSLGRVDYTFTPNLSKTFNRGFTDYFLHGRHADIASFDTPKALGERVGRVKEVRADSFNVSGTASFSNGDGLCFLNDARHLEGFRVNRVVGNRLFPFKMPNGLRPGTTLYRNNDEAFNKLMNSHTARRDILVDMAFETITDGFKLRLSFDVGGGEPSVTAASTVTFAHQVAKTPQVDNIRKQLTKLGNTPYTCHDLQISTEAAGLFVPSSLLSDLRRKAVDALMETTLAWHEQEHKRKMLGALAVESSATAKAWQPAYEKYTYLHNISNHEAAKFYADHGLSKVDMALEVDTNRRDAIVMQCRHCLRYSLGHCVKYGGSAPKWREPLYIRMGDGRRFRLEFKCDMCQMNIYNER